MQHHLRRNRRIRGKIQGLLLKYFNKLGLLQLKDASRSIVRTIQNNLMDSAKQESFDLLLFGHLFGDKQFDKLANLLPSTLLKGYQ